MACPIECFVLKIGDCQLSSLSASDSVEVKVTLSCSDSLIVAALNKESLFQVLSVQPNPATEHVTLTLRNRLSTPIRGQLFDALGNMRLEEEWSGAEATMNTSTLPSGTYFLRLTEGTTTQSRKIIIRH